MSKPKYELISISEDKLRFEFESIGPEKTVSKVVEYEPIDNKGVYYNLALVDVDNDGNYNDKVVTNNKDTDKVFATIARTIDIFFQKYPQKRILIISEDKLRIRLYRMIIANYSNEKEHNLKFYGLVGNKFEEFEKGKDYGAFMIALKNEKIEL